MSWPRLARLVGWLFPPRCQGCGRLGPQPLCTTCLAAIALPLLPRCRYCGDWHDPLARDLELCAGCRARREADRLIARSAAFHEGLTRRLVTRLKYQRRLVAAAALGLLLERWLAADHEALAALGLGPGVVLVPVPLHRRRERWRGFNQARLLAEELGGPVGAQLAEPLARVRPTRPQVGLRPADRVRNVRGAFAVAEPLAQPCATHVLVDDVYTTGATLRECARTLRAAGATKVVALTAARPAQAQWVALAQRYTSTMEIESEGESRLS